MKYLFLLLIPSVCLSGQKLDMSILKTLDRAASGYDGYRDFKKNITIKAKNIVPGNIEDYFVGVVPIVSGKVSTKLLKNFKYVGKSFALTPLIEYNNREKIFSGSFQIIIPLE